MTNADSNRIDRIETLLSQTVELIRSVGQRTDSNARAIEALTNDVKTYQQEAQRDRARLYQSLASLANAQAELASSQANFYQTQSTFYNRLEEVDNRQSELSRRQGEIVEILKILSSRSSQQP
jgi:ABC-type Fe3+-citrate transport system substrate-binding protein